MKLYRIKFVWLVTGLGSAVLTAGALEPMAAFSKDARILFKRRLAENAALDDEQPPLTMAAELRPVASATWRELIKRVWLVLRLVLRSFLAKQEAKADSPLCDYALRSATHSREPLRRA